MNALMHTEDNPSHEGLSASGGPIGSRAFRNALGTFATGVAVVTTKSSDDKPIGITVNSFSSVSLEPPLILISVAVSNFSFPEFLKCRYFAVNVLSAEQREVSRRFARSATDKWRDVPMHYGLFGCPLLKSALSVFECEVERRYDAGDHVILLGKIVGFDYQSSGDPLLFFRGAYGQISES